MRAVAILLAGTLAALSSAADARAEHAGDPGRRVDTAHARRPPSQRPPETVVSIPVAAHVRRARPQDDPSGIGVCVQVGGVSVQVGIGMWACAPPPEAPEPEEPPKPRPPRPPVVPQQPEPPPPAPPPPPPGPTRPPAAAPPPTPRQPQSSPAPAPAAPSATPRRPRPEAPPAAAESPAPSPAPAARRPVQRAEPPHRGRSLSTPVIIMVMTAVIASGTALAFVR
ncbi:hypothetical protein Arub01_50030 [Actinomadura rubrobrunea]|uniref:Uncharacterized protein n=1 Tax=Actinomadura rubrobrunea TaxID=115335 RepID=A0A9W6Q181_9ACTN|nr:hypothetical protein Arub01_50030 [Actinomadura rubrobrunea]